MSNILCLDQSSRITGYSIWEQETKQLIACGKFEAVQEDMAARLMYIRSRLQKFITEFQPIHLYFEDIQLQSSVGNNVVTYKALAEVLGVCIELAKEEGIEYTLVPSTVWKSHCGVRGKQRAEQKRAAQQLVANQFDIKCTQDEADAICIGIYANKITPIVKETRVEANPNDWT